MPELKSFINENKQLIDGIDLDIEENIGLENTIKLIKQINNET